MFCSDEGACVRFGKRRTGFGNQDVIAQRCLPGLAVRSTGAGRCRESVPRVKTKKAAQRLFGYQRSRDC
jgi:hypothetical protein